MQYFVENFERGRESPNVYIKQRRCISLNLVLSVPVEMPFHSYSVDDHAGLERYLQTRRGAGKVETSKSRNEGMPRIRQHQMLQKCLKEYNSFLVLPCAYPSNITKI